MFLFSIEYVIISSGNTYIGKIVGENEQNIFDDIVSQVGEIRVTLLSRLGSEISDKAYMEVVKEVMAPEQEFLS
jgi:S-adenosylmethionine synthetase